MARGINKAIIVGNLGRDPEVRYTANGSAVANVTVATSETWKDKQSGERQERTEWHRVVFFGRLAEIVEEYLKKGSQVYIEGSIRTQKWQDKESGQDRYTTEIVARDMQMLGSRGSGSNTEPDEGYHGLNFAEEFGPQAFIMRARAEGLRDLGACMSPMTAFHILQGVETLPLRMERHVDNARKVVKFLAGSEAVEWVAYPELENHPDKALTTRLLPKGAGSMIAFGIKGGREAGKIFIERLGVWSHLANVGDAKSLVIHPASTTHQQMDSETMKAAGLSEDLVRLSVGLESPDDLITDLEQALKAASIRKAV